MTEGFISTTNLALASALLAIGIDFQEPAFVKARTVKGDQFTFFFKNVSTCGQYDTIQMMNAWNDERYHLENPESPFAYIKCAFNNREALMDKIHQGIDLVVLEKNGKLAVVSKNADVDLQTKIISQL